MLHKQLSEKNKNINYLSNEEAYINESIFTMITKTFEIIDYLECQLYKLTGDIANLMDTKEYQNDELNTLKSRIAELEKNNDNN